MEEFLSELMLNDSMPWLSALALGLLTAISPCPLATNITAIGFISKDLTDRKRVFINGLIYTLGRTIAYFGLAAVIYIGADQFKISEVFQKYGEKLIGPLMILIGVFMLDLVKIKFPGMSKLSGKFQERGIRSYWEVLLLGILFALAFCPYSGVLYFGMLIPMTITSSYGLLLPIIFAIATGVLVILFAWLLAYTVSGVGTLYNKIKIFELWFRRVISVLFIGVGMYYVIIIYF